MPVYRDIVVTDSCARDGKLCIFSSTESRLNNKVDLLVVGGYSVAGGTARGREGGREKREEVAKKKKRNCSNYTPY